MRKWLTLILLAVMCAACVSENEKVTNEIVTIINDAAERLSNAKTSEEIDQINEDTSNKIHELEMKHPDFQPNEEQEMRIQDAVLDHWQAMHRSVEREDAAQ